MNRSTRWYAALGAVVILALAFVIWRQLGQDRAVSTPGDLPSVAVLPLRTFAAEPGQDYFADAMTEALITNLSKIEGLSVRSRQSVMRYAESEDPIPGISEQLRVKYLLEGSVFWGGERLRVDAQLIEGSTDTHIWSNQYEAEVTEVLRVQRDIALAIAQEIGAALTVGDEQRMPTAQNVDPDAYRLLLRGRAILWRGHGPQRELAQEAKPFFEQAVERDSSFAEAWAALANAQALIANYRVEPLETAGPLASRYLNRALELSPTLSEPYLTKSLLAQLNGDWTRAEEALRQAISLAPGNSSHYGELCLYQLRTGRVNEALEAARKALELDPVSGYSHQVMTQAHYYARDFDEAIEWGQTWLESGGYRDMPLWYITRSYLDGGRSEQAIRVAEEAVAADSTEVSLFRLSYLRTLTGGREDHMELLAWCEEQGWTPCAAHLNILLGHRDRALDHLEEMYRDRRGTTTYIAVEPWWDPLRSEPRFQAIMRQLGLEPES